jgi:uncharacterized RDD family membrane protein YckC
MTTTKEEPQGRTFLGEVRNEVKPVAVALCADICLFLILLTALVVAFIALRLLAALGYLAERVAILESVHYWAYLAVFVMFLIDLILKIGSHIADRMRGNK